MTLYLLDTNILRGVMGRNAAVGKWLDTVDDSDIWLSAHTLYESRVGIERALKKDASNPGALKGLDFVEALEAAYRDRIAGFDAAAAREAAKLVAQKGVDEKDRMIVAVARVNGMTLVTRNAKDMCGLGVPVLNPYTDPPDRFDAKGKRLSG